MTEPDWLTREMILDAYAEQLAIFGGGDGMRDPGLLESALARAPNKWNYGETNLAALAAAYALGLSRNHPFVDGKKRVAFTAIIMFLALNDVGFAPAKADATAAMLALAAGEVDEAILTRWIADNSRP